MLALAKTENAQVKYLLKNTYQAVYSKMLHLLTEEEISLFARPAVGQKETLWETPLNGEVVALSGLSELERTEADAKYRSTITAILKKLGNDSEFTLIKDKLFAYPSEDALKAIKTNNGIRIVITQWACETNKDFSVYGSVEDPYKNPSEKMQLVDVYIDYTNGSKAISESLRYQYRDINNSFDTDENAKASFGNFAVGSSVKIGSDQISPSRWGQLTVIEGQQNYNVTLPIFGELTVRVINQQGKTLADIALTIESVNERMEVISNDLGLTEPCLFEATQDPIKISLKTDTSKHKFIELQKGSNLVDFEVYELIEEQLQVGVINEKNIVQPNYTVFINGDRAITGPDGKTSPRKYELGSNVAISDELDNSLSHVMKVGSNEVWLKVISPEPPTSKFRLVNFWNRPWKNAEVQVELGSEVRSIKTDENGVFTVLQEDLSELNEVKISLLRKSKKGKELKPKVKRIKL